MAGTQMKNGLLILVVVSIALFIAYQYDPTLFGLLGSREGFADSVTGKKDMTLSNGNGNMKAGQMAANGKASMDQNANAKTVNKGDKNANMGANKPATAATPYVTEKANKAAADVQGSEDAKAEGFANLVDYEGPANFGAAEAPAGCYPRDQLTPSELLPRDMNSIWAEQNPMGPGSLKGKNFLSAGALIGVNTVGQSMRNANLQVRSEPPNPQVPVSIFNQSTIAPDISHRPLEIGA
jgi:hypothetical protein